MPGVGNCVKGLILVLNEVKGLILVLFSVQEVRTGNINPQFAKLVV